MEGRGPAVHPHRFISEGPAKTGELLWRRGGRWETVWVEDRREESGRKNSLERKFTLGYMVGDGRFRSVTVHPLQARSQGEKCTEAEIAEVRRW